MVSVSCLDWLKKVLTADLEAPPSDKDQELYLLS
jgi:hypothetical protein